MFVEKHKDLSLKLRTHLKCQVSGPYAEMGEMGGTLRLPVSQAERTNYRPEVIMSVKTMQTVPEDDT